MWNYTEIGTLKHELMLTMSSQIHTNLNKQYLLIRRNLKANYKIQIKTLTWVPFPMVSQHKKPALGSYVRIGFIFKHKTHN